jgi:DNA invertase Pin-like site-specific DNA recombinase
MNIGYARVSTEAQEIARQTRAFNELGIEKVFIDKASGKNAEREQLKAMLSFIREGDVVTVESISRIARNTRDLLTITDIIHSRGADFVSLKESIDTSTPQGKFVFTVFGAMAELERECILQRTREGVAIAKEQGKYKGKPKMKIDEATFRKEVKRWRDGLQTATEAMKALNLKPNTFYRRVKEYGL